MQLPKPIKIERIETKDQAITLLLNNHNSLLRYLEEREREKDEECDCTPDIIHGKRNHRSQEPPKENGCYPINNSTLPPKEKEDFRGTVCARCETKPCVCTKPELNVEALLDEYANVRGTQYGNLGRCQEIINTLKQALR